MGYSVDITTFRHELIGNRIMLLPNSVDFSRIVTFEHQGIYCDDCGGEYCDVTGHTGAYHHYLYILRVNRRKVLARVLEIPVPEVNEEFFILWEGEDAPLDNPDTYRIYGQVDSSDDSEQVHVKFLRDHTATVEKLRTMYAEFVA